MRSKLRTFVLGILFFVFVLDSYATAPITNSGLSFEKNKSQWPSQVLFKADIPSGRLFIEKSKLTYLYYNQEDLDRCHNFQEDESGEGIMPDNSMKVHCHAFKVNFLGSSETASVTGEQIKSEYFNYFIGNDSTKWSSNVQVFNGASYSNIYPSIDLKLYSLKNQLKYDFILKPGAHVDDIKLEYEGVNSITLKDGNLLIEISTGVILEQAPYAFQIINGTRSIVQCTYRLIEDQVTFSIGSEYDNRYPLVIDPLIVAATYTGSTVDAIGCSATYDSQGNIYSSGYAWNQGYPTTIGAFDTTYTSINDIVVSKFNPNGSTLVYSTYLGGTGQEETISMVTNSNNELCLFGQVRFTADYPITLNSFDNSYNGRDDIIITHLNSTGTALLGSTYIGGTQQESNEGEIIVDSLGNYYVVGTTNSTDFPLTFGTRPNINNRDAVVFALNSSCSNLLWSTFLGGSMDEEGYSIRIYDPVSVVIAGATRSADFPVTAGAFQSSIQGGWDGFITRLNFQNNSVLASTYFGTNVYDDLHFIDLDSAKNIYVFGETRGFLSITPGAYSNIGSHNAIAKFTAALDSPIFQTVIGNTVNPTALVPTAFGLDVCNNIHLAGFVQRGLGYPVTPDALSPTPTLATGPVFYAAELSGDGGAFLHGTFLVAGNSWGASRFDRNGVLYQACNADSGLTTTSNAFAPNNLSGGKDIFALKFDMQSVGAVATANAETSSIGCAPDTIQFSSLGNGMSFLWNFGDGTPVDTMQNPVHLFTDSGQYNVQLIVFDSTGCVASDTAYINFYIAPSLVQHSGIDTIICSIPSISLNTNSNCSGCSYAWNNSQDSSSIYVSSPGIYSVTVSNGQCAITDTFFVDKLIIPTLGNDTSLCDGQILNLNSNTIGNSFVWSTGDTLTSIIVNQSNIYWVDASKQDCILRDSIEVIFLDYPMANLGNDTLICPNTYINIPLDASSPNTNYLYLWSTGEITGNIIANSAGVYFVSVANEHCISYDTIQINQSLPLIKPKSDLAFCSNTEAWLDVEIDSVSYLWNTGDSSRKILALNSGLYWYQISYANCLETDSIDVTITNSGLWIPNAFTPNGDGRNDIFMPFGSDIQELSLDIYNRWGEHLFSSNNLSKGWDGTANGNLVQPGVYAFKISYLTGCSQEYFYKDGYVLVVE